MKLKAIVLCGLAGLVSLLIMLANWETVIASGQQSGPLSNTWNPQLRSFVFGEPIVPVGGVQADLEDEVYLRTILAQAKQARAAAEPASNDRYALQRAIATETVAELEEFVANRPNSIWAPSVRNRLGSFYLRRGQTTKAMEQWLIVWEMTKQLEDRNGRATADYALAYYTRQLVLLGRTDLLEEAFRLHEGRILSGGMHEFWERTREKHRRMIKYPDSSYKCGIYALDQVAQALNLPYKRGEFLNIPSKIEGLSLGELEAISDKYTFGLSAVKRAGESRAIPVPSVVHWRQFHYAAIVAQTRDGLYKVVDPSAAGVLFLTGEEINAEATGYFMAPRNFSGEFRQLQPDEASLIFGRASSCPPEDDEDGDSCEDDSGGEGDARLSNCSGCSKNGGHSSQGMATYRVSEPYLNVFITDTPFFYTPSKGPAVNLTLRYKLNSTPGFWEPGFGSKFSHPWRSRVEPAGDGYTENVLLPGPQKLAFSFDDGNDTEGGTYRSRAVLERILTLGAITSYRLHHPDGSSWLYDLEDDNGWFHLTEVTDPSGDSLVIDRDSSDAQKIETITDASGGVVTFHYEHGTYDHLVTRVTGPGGREASFEYQYTAYAFNVTEITDMAGIETDLAYTSQYGEITSFTTPYGTTHFARPSPGYSTYDRAIVVTLPNGAQEVYLLVDSFGGTVPAFDSAQLPLDTPFAAMGYDYGTIETTDRSERNTFYWNAKQYGSLANTNIATMTWTEFKQARIRHWLWKLSEGSFNHVDTLNHEQLPSPDGSTEGAITWHDYDGKDYDSPQIRGTRPQPAVIARVQPDGSTAWTWYQRNDWGKPETVIERWVEGGAPRYRTNSYVFSGDGIDLKEHWFGSADGEHFKVGYGYNGSYPHQPVRMTNALSEITYYTYDVDKRLKTTQYPSGLISSNLYDGNGFLSSTIDFADAAVFRTNSYTWENHLLKTHTDERALTITNSYDALGRLLQVDFPDGSNIKHGYTNWSGDTILDRTYLKDRMGSVTTWDYNSMGQMIRMTNALGTVTAHGYCVCGSLDSVTNGFGSGLDLVTSYAYDQQGRRTHTFNPGGINLTNVFDGWGRVTTSMDALSSTLNGFDNLGRLVTVSNVFGQVSRKIYDDEGMVRTNIDANGVSTIMTYDDLHRLSTRTVAGGGTETYGYSANISGPTSYTNQLSKVTQYTYNDLGWKTKEVNVGMATNSFTYNEAGDLRTLSDGKSQTTSWGYDVYGRQTSKTNANNLPILSYAYDANSRLTNRWSAAKGNTGYGHDAVGNLLSINYPSSTDISYQYDALNRMTNMVDAVGTTYWYHDHANRQTVEDGPWASDNVTNKWNTAGLRERLGVQQPTGYFNTAYTYDAAKRLDRVTSPAGTFTNWYHLGLNGITAATRLLEILELPNGAYIDNLYDGLGRLTVTSLNQSNGTGTNAHAYVYNNANQRTKQTRMGGEYVNYLYDDAGQLYSARTYSVSHSEVMSERFGYDYDPAWNLEYRTNNAAVTTYLNNQLNQITNLAGSTLSYDGNGNLTNHPALLSYAYDDENQLTFIQKSGWWRTELVYDGKMRLRKRAEYTGGSGGYTLTSETLYLYDGMLQVQERNSANTPTVTYTRGHDLSGTLAGAGGIGGLLARSHGYSSGTGNWITHTYYHADGNGNVTFLITPTQTIAASYKYNPFGGTISSSGSLASANIMRFSSKEFHANSGMYYYGYRWYDPNLQRWLNRDPLHDLGFQSAALRPTFKLFSRPAAGSENPYTMVRNNAITLIDAFGLETCDDDPEPCWQTPEEFYCGDLEEGSLARAACEKGIEAILEKGGLRGKTAGCEFSYKNCQACCDENFESNIDYWETCMSLCELSKLLCIAGL